MTQVYHKMISFLMFPANIFIDLLSLSKSFLMQQAMLVGLCVCIYIDICKLFLHNIIHFSLYHTGNNKVTDCNALAS